jgi:hypothetical protein
LAKHEGDADDDGDSHAYENGFGSDKDIDTGDNDSTVRVVSSRGKRDGCDIALATPGGAVSVKDWGVYDGPYSDPEDRDAGNDDTAVEKPQVLDHREDIETYVDAVKNGNIANSRKGVITVLTNICFWLD